MTFSVARHGDDVVVGVEGHLVIRNRRELERHVLDELERGARRFRIDFGHAAYVDSSGLGALVSLNKRVRERKGELRLTNLNAELRQLFELTRLDTLFDWDEREGDAAAGGRAPLGPSRSGPPSGTAQAEPPSEASSPDGS